MYLHILNYPENGELRLTLEKTETGYTVILPAREECDAMDTVVKLK